MPAARPPQVETIAIAKLRSDPNLTFRREIIVTQDGGAVAIDWEHFDLEEHVSGKLGFGGGQAQRAAPGGPAAASLGAAVKCLGRMRGGSTLAPARQLTPARPQQCPTPPGPA